MLPSIVSYFIETNSVLGESFFDFTYLISRRTFIAFPKGWRGGSNDMSDTVQDVFGAMFVCLLFEYLCRFRGKGVI